MLHVCPFSTIMHFNPKYRESDVVIMESKCVCQQDKNMKNLNEKS